MEWRRLELIYGTTLVAFIHIHSFSVNKWTD